MQIAADAKMAEGAGRVQLLIVDEFAVVCSTEVVKVACDPTPVVPTAGAVVVVVVPWAEVVVPAAAAVVPACVPVVVVVVPALDPVVEVPACVPVVVVVVVVVPEVVAVCQTRT
jgi:hypothetical protein